MKALRGRAASPLRPGFLIKSVLSGTTPLETHEGKMVVDEACISDIHYTYRQHTKYENEVRPIGRKLRGMTYRSFATCFRFAYLLGLVEKVREEPGPPHLRRVSKREDGEYVVVPSSRVVYRLTSLGVEDELAWTDLTHAWKENWVLPQKVPEAVYVPRAEVVREEKVPTPAFEKLKLPEKPTKQLLTALADHLEELISLGVSEPGVSEEIYTMIVGFGHWVSWYEDQLEEAKVINYTTKIKSIEAILSYMRPIHEKLSEAEVLEGVRMVREFVEELR